MYSLHIIAKSVLRIWIIVARQQWPTWVNYRCTSVISHCLLELHALVDIREQGSAIFLCLFAQRGLLCVGLSKGWGRGRGRNRGRWRGWRHLHTLPQQQACTRKLTYCRRRNGRINAACLLPINSQNEKGRHIELKYPYVHESCLIRIRCLLHHYSCEKQGTEYHQLARGQWKGLFTNRQRMLTSQVHQCTQQPIWTVHTYLNWASH